MFDACKKLIWLPVDLVTLTGHWLRGVLWSVIHASHKLLELPTATNWPFQCFTQKTPSGRNVCIPGNRYRNPNVFRLLCHDLKRDACEGCYCRMTMYETYDRWRPGWLRVVAVGIGLAMAWTVPAYGIYWGMRAWLPTPMKSQIRSWITPQLIERPREIGASVSDSDKEKSNQFLAHSDQLLAAGNFDGALLEYRNAIQRDPENVQAHVGRGHCLMKLGRPLTAMDSYKRVVQLQPDRWEAHLALARIGKEIGDLAITREHSQAVIRWNPNIAEGRLLFGLTLSQKPSVDHPAIQRELLAVEQLKIESDSDLLLAGFLYQTTGNVQQAEEYFRRAVEQSPTSIDARLSYAHLLGKAGRYNEAESHLQHARSAAESDINVLVGLAELNVLKGDDRKAIEHYEHIISLNGASESHHLRLAELYLRVGESDKSLTILENIVNKNPDHVVARIGLAELLLRHRLIESAMAHAQAVLSRQANNLAALAIVARGQMIRKQFDAAVETLKRYQQLDAGNIEITLLLANACYEAGLPQEAENRYREAVQAYPTSSLPLVGLGRLLMLTHREAEAMDLFRRALVIQPDDLVAANNLAILLLKRDETLQEAYELTQTLASRRPDHPAILNAYGYACYKRGEYERAKKVLTMSLRMNNRLSGTYYHLGKTLVELREFDTAVQLFETYLSMPNLAQEAEEVDVEEVRCLLEQIRAY